MKARHILATLAVSVAHVVTAAAQPTPATTGAEPIPAASQAPAGNTSETGDNLTVYLLTFGWGDAVWERFGHNAIWIKDAARGTDITYNWGMFDFDQPHFVWRFVTGETRYWMEPIELQPMLRYYRQNNRSILAQELNLTPAERLELQRFVQWNALPENKFYRYDYYRDNCSTRLRDAIDHALGGRLQTATVSRTTTGTYRWHTQRLLSGDFPMYTGVTLALGHPADKPLSVWEEMFLPVRMANDLRTVRIADSTGALIPLVRSERAIFTAGKPPEPSAPWNYFPLYVAIGILGAALLIVLVRNAEHGNRISLVAAGTLATLWSLIAGVAGLALVFAWLFTKHYFMGRNENLLHFDPLSLIMVALVPLAVFGQRAVWRTLKLAAFIALLSLFGFVLQGIPAFGQSNGEIIALALPLNLAVWWTVYRLTAYRRTSLPSSAAL